MQKAAFCALCTLRAKLTLNHNLYITSTQTIILFPFYSWQSPSHFSLEQHPPFSPPFPTKLSIENTLTFTFFWSFAIVMENYGDIEGNIVVFISNRELHSPEFSILVQWLSKVPYSLLTNVQV